MTWSCMYQFYRKTARMQKINVANHNFTSIRFTSKWAKLVKVDAREF